MFNNATYTLELQGSGAAPAAGSLALTLHPNLVFQVPGAAPAAGSLAPPLHPNLVFQGPVAAPAAGSLALFYTLTLCSRDHRVQHLLLVPWLLSYTLT